MNLLELLGKEIQNKHLNNDEKIRYIYLRLCEIFSYDTKWKYVDLIGGYKELLKIKNKLFNIENINDYEVICHNFVPHILIPLIKEFTGVECEELEDNGHTYTTYPFDGNEYMLDATGFYDMAYVKMGLTTKGFRPLAFSNTNEKLIQDMDKSLGYNLMSELEYKEKLDINPNASIYEKNLKIAKVLESSKCKKYYSDARRLISTIDYMLDILSSMQYYAPYFTEDYKFTGLYHIPNEEKFFSLSNDSGEYKFEEITKDKCISLSNKLITKSKTYLW